MFGWKFEFGEVFSSLVEWGPFQLLSEMFSSVSDIFWFVHSFPKHLKCLVESLNLEKYFPAGLSGGHLSYSQDVSNLLYGATTTLYAFSGTYLNSPPYSVFVVVLTTAQEDACWVSFPSTLMRYHPEERWGLVWNVLHASTKSTLPIIIFPYHYHYHHHRDLHRNTNPSNTAGIFGKNSNMLPQPKWISKSVSFFWNDDF